MTGLIVVGSGPAGVAAAEAFRGNQSELPVHILTQDHAPPYHRPPLSKEYLRGDDSDVALHPAHWYADRAIQVTTGTTVAHLDTGAHQVIDTAGVRYQYTRLVLACGARPRPLDVPGGEFALQLRSLRDAARLREFARHSTRAVVIGAGFIGCEAAGSLAAQGVSTIVVSSEPVPQAARLGSQVGKRLVELLSDAEVSYAGGVSVSRLGERRVVLDIGVTIDCDLVLAATGADPNVELAAAAGIETTDGRVVVDEHQRTSVPDVFAAGDVALAHNRSAGRPLVVEHWQDGIDQGTVAGANAAGATAVWDAVPGFWTTIGSATLKYHAWGDGFDRGHLVEREDGFTVWYERAGRLVGALTLNADADYDRAEDVIRRGDPMPVG